LNLLLRSKSASLKIFPKLDKQVFSDKYYRHLFEEIQAYWFKYFHIPKISSILESLSKKVNNSDLDKIEMILAKISDLEVDRTYSEFYADKLVESFKARKFMRIVNSSLDFVESGKVEEAIQSTQLEIAKLQHTEIEKESKSDYMTDFKDRRKLVIDRQTNPEKYRGIPTGIKQFDNFYGGLLESELGLVVGGTGKGKSICLMNFAVAAWLKNYDVVYLTIEMSKRECEFRIDSRLANIEHRKFRKGDLDQEEFDKWTSKIKLLKNKVTSTFHILDFPEGCTTDLIEMKLLQMKKQLPKKFLLVIDYMNLMFSKYARRNSDDWQVQGWISRELKMLARSWSIPIWTAAQLKARSVNKEITEAEDVGRSYGISQNVNFMLSLIQTREDELDGVMRMICAKGRDGKMPVVRLHPDLGKMRLNIAYFGDKNEKKKI